MAVYLDLVMLLNFLVDYLLLLGTNRLSGSPMTPGRCALAAAFTLPARHRPWNFSQVVFMAS